METGPFSERNEEPDLTPSNLVFIIEVKNHLTFTRYGNDLIMGRNISLVEALTCYKVPLTRLNGTRGTITINKEVIHPSFEAAVEGEGIPLPEDPSKKGYLRVRFDIKFPTSLTAEQKSGIKKLLLETVKESPDTPKIEEKHHSTFTEYGNGLSVKQDISLAEALTWDTVHLTTPDGRSLTIPIPINDVTDPLYMMIEKREGMPLPEGPSKRGDLRIRFNIKFPKSLTEEQKSGIKKLLLETTSE